MEREQDEHRAHGALLPPAPLARGRWPRRVPLGVGLFAAALASACVELTPEVESAFEAPRPEERSNFRREPGEPARSPEPSRWASATPSRSASEATSPARPEGACVDSPDAGSLACADDGPRRAGAAP